MTTLGRLAASLFRRAPPEVNPASQSLLETTELAALAGQARHWPLPRMQLDIHEHHAGDWSATGMGRGLDFEDSRPYAPGDDLRDMDWRSTARLGHPFVKIYREERQPIWHVVVDHGPTMCFGTRRRIKAAQAARLGVLLAHVAHHHGIALGCSVWNGSDLMLPASHGESGLLARVRAMTAACPPRAFEPPLPVDLAARFRKLRAEVPRGAQLWLLSDGRGFDDGVWRMLALLSDAVSLRFVRILDRTEHTLPDLGLVAFDAGLGGGTGAPRWIDTSIAAERERLAEDWRKERDAQDARLARLGLRAIDLDAADDDLLAIGLRLAGSTA